MQTQQAISAEKLSIDIVAILKRYNIPCKYAIKNCTGEEKELPLTQEILFWVGDNMFAEVYFGWQLDPKCKSIFVDQLKRPDLCPKTLCVEIYEPELSGSDDAIVEFKLSIRTDNIRDAIFGVASIAIDIDLYEKAASNKSR